MDWTEEQVLALAPNALTLRQTQALAAPAGWATLGRSKTSVWGTQELQGFTFQASLDLTRFVSTCSCPGFGASCAHAIGLRLLLLQQPRAFQVAEPPHWVAAQAASELAAPSRTSTRGGLMPWSVQQAIQHPANPALLAHQQRCAAALATWLRALIDNGLRHVPPGAYDSNRTTSTPWDEHVFSLMNWELPGLAAALRELANQCPNRELTEEETDQLLASLGKLYTLAHAFLTRQQLPIAWQRSLRLCIGVPFLAHERVKTQQPAVADTWHVLSLRTPPESAWYGSSWYERSTWLWGQTTGRYALVYEMRWHGNTFANELEPTGRYRGELFFYPDPDHLRAVLATDWPASSALPAAWPVGLSLAELPPIYADARAQIPWLAEWPVTLGPLVPVVTPAGAICLYEPATQQRIPLRGAASDHWHLLAFGGGEALTVFGEWNGHALLPLSYWLASGFTSAPLA